MTLREELILKTLAGYFVLALCAGIPFGIWMESWSAGIFMTFLAFVLEGNAK